MKWTRLILPLLLYVGNPAYAETGECGYGAKQKIERKMSLERTGSALEKLLSEISECFKVNVDRKKGMLSCYAGDSQSFRLAHQYSIQDIGEVVHDDAILKVGLKNGTTMIYSFPNERTAVDVADTIRDFARAYQSIP